MASAGKRFVEITVYDNANKKKAVNPLVSDLEGQYTLSELLEHTKSSLIVIADQILGEEQKKGFDKNPVTAVDGRINKPVASVHPLGQIEFTTRADIKDILLETYESLLTRSKVLTGRYKSSHVVFYNGAQVATDLRSLAQWYSSNATKLKGDDKIRFVNIQPYARRLERLGVTAQRTREARRKTKRKGQTTGVTVKVPNGAYALTARAIKSKYKRNSSIRFTFLPGSSLGLSGSFKGGRHGKNSAGRPYLYPTIVITVSEKGTT